MAASTFLFHPLMNEVVPYNAVYEFPSQATRSTKRTVKITPKNSSASYVSGSTIRFEFPASGYLNPNTTYLAFNCRSKITSGSFTAGSTTAGGFAFQNNIASIFRRVRVLYGSLVLEDIQDYNVLQRLFTETLTASGTGSCNTSCYQGIGPLSNQQGTQLTAFAGPMVSGFKFDRFNYHALENATGTGIESGNIVGRTGRRYCIPLNTGVFQQKRLIPLKFMSSQLQIEFELAEAVDCQQWIIGTGGSPTIPTSCQTEVGQPEIVAELLEFDSEFDQAVFQGLQQGLAIPFQSWHVTSYNLAVGINFQINIQESSRSVRYALATLTDDANRTLDKDAHAFVSGWNLTSTAPTAAALNPADGYHTVTNATLLESFQWRLGGVYYPSQPVPCYGGTAALADGSGIDSNYADPPVEAYMELMKVFDNQFVKRYSAGDYCNQPFSSIRDNTNVETGGFVIACDFMTDRGDVIGGINAEEQNDMMLLLKFVGAGSGTNKVLRVAVCYDNVMILGENNNLVLVN